LQRHVRGKVTRFASGPVLPTHAIFPWSSCFY
jgi:hypothetical protein